jgi:reverse gyrase
MEPFKNSADAKMKMIDRIIKAYQAKKLMLQAQQIQQSNVKEEKDKSFKSVKQRMNDAYQKNKRQKKIDKLQAIQTHWKGLN